MSTLVDLETSQGTIRVELDDANAPKSAANFAAYVREGHYDGTVFHRVIKGFMIQGGGFAVGMEQKPTLAAIAKYGVTDRIGYISTGGGAFLEFLEGKVLPAVEILEQRAAG